MVKVHKLNAYRLIRNIVVLAFLAASYAALLPTSYLDDLFVLVLGMVVFVKLFVQLFLKRKKLSRPVAVTILLLLAETIFLLPLLFQSDERASAINSYIVIIKVIVIILSCFCSSSTFEEKANIQKVLFIFSIPNIIRGLYEYYYVYILGNYLENGKYEFGLGYRLQGFTGHPIYFSLLIIMCNLFLLYIAKGKIRVIIALICSFLCVYTWTSFSLVLMFGIWGFLIIQFVNLSKYLHKIIWPIMSLIIVGFIYILTWYVKQESYAIRIVAIIGTVKQLKFLNFFFGNGFGSFTSAGYGEAYFFHVLYDNGIIGLVLLLFPILYIIKEQIRTKNYIAVFYITSFVMNIIINEGYLIPYILYFPLICNHVKQGYTELERELT